MKWDVTSQRDDRSGGISQARGMTRGIGALLACYVTQHAQQSWIKNESINFPGVVLTTSRFAQTQSKNQPLQNI